MEKSSELELEGKDNFERPLNDLRGQSEGLRSKDEKEKDPWTCYGLRAKSWAKIGIIVNQVFNQHNHYNALKIKTLTINTEYLWSFLM